MRRILSNRWVATAVAIAMVLVLLICLFRPDQFHFLRTIARYSLHLMFLYLAAGLAFLILGKKRLLFLALGCCALLCIVLKIKADASIRAISTTSQPMAKVIQSSISSLSEDWDAAYQALVDSDADMVAVLEVTPSWKDVLDSYLLEHFPFASTNVRIDDLGTAIYSKHPLVASDILMTADVPSLVVEATVESMTLHVIVSNSFPPLFRQSFQDLRRQLESTALLAASRTEVPLLTIGDYNLDQFSDELQDFRALGALRDSRKTMTPSLSPPTNHIFHNEMLEFQHFSNLYDQNSNRIGIQGIYQYSDEKVVAKRGG